eukprot:CAMPEP_0196671798 /NCGR_PEP_ID=MMETSP1090-20130531/2030_1 /TAXON_ID=37098 /ORGANISM="Isochrysis sp, Strain CCMP1244" /LENGTH=54 /DNA_ID=CAMNT_0042009481 /DNA_START=141 /DNA_END=302 /DNA_ORIENTATION=+
MPLVRPEAHATEARHEYHPRAALHREPSVQHVAGEEQRSPSLWAQHRRRRLRRP